MTPFSALLSDLCQSRRILQKQLAYRLGINPTYLSAIINGRKGIPSESFKLQLYEVLALNTRRGSLFLTGESKSLANPLVSDDFLGICERASRYCARDEE